MGIISTMLSTVGSIIDKITTTDKEKDKIKSEVSYAIMQHLDKITEAQKEIITSEAKGNWLQRSWRPIVMLTFTCIVVMGIFIEIPMLKNGSQFWDLLEIGLGGYVIGRSAEKITTTIGKCLK
jgi:hypothetical protein